MSSRQPTEETFPRPKRYLPYRENDSRLAFQLRSYQQPKEKTILFCKFQRIDRRIVEIVSTKERYLAPRFVRLAVLEKWEYFRDSRRRCR